MGSQVIPPLPPGFTLDQGGLLSAGNIDLNNRPRVQNPDGSVSTVRSISIGVDGKEVLIPTVSEDGRVMSNDEAIKQYQKTGRNLGVFDSPDHATAYAQKLHNDQASLIGAGRKIPPLPPGFRLDKTPAGASDAETGNLSDTQDDAFSNLMMSNDDQIEAQKGWAPVVAGMVAGPIAGEAGPTVARIASSPLTSGALMGALDFAKTGSIPSALKEAVYEVLLGKAGNAIAGPLSKIVPSSLMARMTHGLAAAAMTEIPAAAAAVAPEVAEAAPAAYRGIPALMNIGATGAEDAASAAEALRASQGASRMVDLAKSPVVAQAVKAPVEDVARVGWAARTEDYAKWKAGGGIITPAMTPPMVLPAAAAPVAEAAAPVAATVAGDAGDALLQNRLRASMLLKQNPAALAEEVAAKVVQLKQGIGKGLSAAQVGSSLEDLYGFSKSTAKNMVDMIFQTHGLR